MTKTQKLHVIFLPKTGPHSVCLAPGVAATWTDLHVYYLNSDTLNDSTSQQLCHKGMAGKSKGAPGVAATWTGPHQSPSPC